VLIATGIDFEEKVNQQPSFENVFIVFLVCGFITLLFESLSELATTGDAFLT
jgi:hypothetical protein